MPPKRVRSSPVAKEPAKTPALGATAAETDNEEDSDDYSDPEDDISAEEMESLEAELSFRDFNSAREAGRERVAPRTRRQYDLFIGLMAKFLKDDEEFAELVVSKSDNPFSSVKCPVPLQAIKKYVDYVEGKQVPVRESDKESLSSHQCTKHVGIGYFSVVIQSLFDLYKCEQVLMSDETRLFIEARRSIYSRKIAQLKANGLYPTPPSRFISDDGYVALCKTICIATPTEGCWADTLLASLWAYVVLLWNLMARCDRVAQLMWQNISWYKDCMTVFVAKSKSDQTGVRAFEKKLYCAKDPSVCPVLSCAVLFFTRTDYRSVFVFPRADTRRSGLRQLGHLIAARFSEANYALFGCNPLHIAWHHFKRGAFTFLGALTDGPSWVGCKLRADQTVSDSSKPYLYQGSGQDGLIGRLLALLPYGDPGFLEGPPALPADVIVPWDVIIPDWDVLPSHFKYSVIPRFFFGNRVSLRLAARKPSQPSSRISLHSVYNALGTAACSKKCCDARAAGYAACDGCSSQRPNGRSGGAVDRVAAFTTADVTRTASACSSSAFSCRSQVIAACASRGQFGIAHDSGRRELTINLSHPTLFMRVCLACLVDYNRQFTDAFAVLCKKTSKGRKPCSRSDTFLKNQEGHVVYCYHNS